jgi:hypothetical protein
METKIKQQNESSCTKPTNIPRTLLEAEYTIFLLLRPPPPRVELEVLISITREALSLSAAYN